MTELVLFPHELEPGGLPDRCLVCGATGCTPVKKQFQVSVGETSYAVVSVHQLRQREGSVPLCPRHLQHFLSPIYAGGVGCGVFAAAVALAILVGLIGNNTVGPSYTAGFTALALIVAGTVTAVILARSIKNGAVQETDVTEEGVHLKNLAPEFVEAALAARQERHRPA
jgi:hypothetical protein